MPKKIEERIHILSPYRGYLAPANVMGPIVHPLVVNKSVVAKILMSGADVYEYIPHNKKTLKLTLVNLNDPNRYNELDVKVVKAEPVPVAPITRTGVPTVVEPVEVSEPEATADEDQTVEDVSEETATTDVSVTEEPDVEVKDEETAVEEPGTTHETQQPASAFEFEYNEDGTVNEDKIEWAKYSKNQRKEIRAQINQHNASLAK